MPIAKDIDYSKLNRAMLEAAGSRSLRKFSKDCDIDRTVFGHMLEKKYRPSFKTITRIAVNAEDTSKSKQLMEEMSDAVGLIVTDRYAKKTAHDMVFISGRDNGKPILQSFMILDYCRKQKGIGWKEFFDEMQLTDYEKGLFRELGIKEEYLG